MTGYRNGPNRAIRWAAGLLACALSGCGREAPTEGDNVYQALLENERQMRSAIRQQAAMPEDQLAVRLVQTSAAPSGDGVVTNWVAHTLATYRTTLFPRWIARKAGTGRYDVRFTCLVTDSSGAAHPIGYAWSADVALGVVRGPRTLSDEELRMEWKGRMRFPSPGASSETGAPP